MQLRNVSKGSKVPFVDKKFHSYMIIRAGTVYWPSLFVDKIATMNGDFVIVKGVKFEDYEGFASPNASSVTKVSSVLSLYNSSIYPSHIFSKIFFVYLMHGITLQ